MDVREQTIETEDNGEESVVKEDDYKKILLGRVLCDFCHSHTEQHSQICMQCIHTYRVFATLTYAYHLFAHRSHTLAMYTRPTHVHTHVRVRICRHTRHTAGTCMSFQHMHSYSSSQVPIMLKTEYCMLIQYNVQNDLCSLNECTYDQVAS